MTAKKDAFSKRNDMSDDTENVAETAPAEAAPAEAAPAEAAPEGEAVKRRPGRPPKDSRPRTDTVEGSALPKPRKGPDEYKDTGAAVKREIERLTLAVEAHKKAHPETPIDSEIGTALVAMGFRPLKDPELPPPEIFVMFLSQPMTLLGAALDVTHAVPAEKDLKVCGEAWRETCAVFGFSSKWLVLAAALISTFNLAVPMIAARIVGDTDTKRGKFPVLAVKAGESDVTKA